MSVSFRDDMTVAEAKDLLRGLLDDGERCPCCTQRAQVYRRSIHSSMARGLIKLYKRQPHIAFHEIALFMEHRELADFAKLAYWGLVEEQPSLREDGSNRTGFWKITDLGLDFVEGRVTVAKHARVYDGRCLGLAGPDVAIKDCLGRRFSYAELMGLEQMLKIEETRTAVSPAPVVSEAPGAPGMGLLGHAAVGDTTPGASETPGPRNALFDEDTY